MKIATIVGARPQFIKAAVVSRVLRQHHEELLVHTGQHYDDNMSAVFFEELGIPEPDCNLDVGSGLHGEQTAAMLARVEGILLNQRPDWVLVYGDTNTTLAGALAAAKLPVRVAHVEAGLRSFDRTMPEELNRVVVDHLSNLLLCPSQTAVENLCRENITAGVHLVGDVMADALAFAAARAPERASVLERLGLVDRGYLLATLHRAENTDNRRRLHDVLAAFDEIEEPIVFPVHPRTRKAIDAAGAPRLGTHLRVIDPVGHLDMVRLIQGARVVLTDSGGLQKEAYWLGRPCITLRDQTEWVETVAAGWNVIAGTDRDRIIEAVRSCSPPDCHPPLYGDGHAAHRVVRALETA
jgi:UDP-N-acetylglucosamine 2-epimerase